MYNKWWECYSCSFQAHMEVKHLKWWLFKRNNYTITREKSDLPSHLSTIRKHKEVPVNMEHNIRWLKTNNCLDFQNSCIYNQNKLKMNKLGFQAIYSVSVHLRVSNSSKSTWLSCNEILLACDGPTNSWSWFLNFKGKAPWPASEELSRLCSVSVQNRYPSHSDSFCTKVYFIQLKFEPPFFFVCFVWAESQTLFTSPHWNVHTEDRLRRTFGVPPSHFPQLSRVEEKYTLFSQNKYLHLFFFTH